METPASTESSAEARVLAQLKLIFDAVHANEDHEVSKVELSDALEKDQNLGLLLRDAGMSDIWWLLRHLDKNHDGHISWDEVVQYVKTTVWQEMKDLEEMVLRRLKAIFGRLSVHADGAVRKDEFAAKLSEEDEHGSVNDDSLGKLVEQVGFNPCWKTLDHLDTSQDGLVTWDEFTMHLRRANRQEMQEIVLGEETSAPCCGACC